MWVFFSLFFAFYTFSFILDLCVCVCVLVSVLNLLGNWISRDSTKTKDMQCACSTFLFVCRKLHWNEKTKEQTKAPKSHIQDAIEDDFQNSLSINLNVTDFDRESHSIHYINNVENLIWMAQRCLWKLYSFQIIQFIFCKEKKNRFCVYKILKIHLNIAMHKNRLISNCNRNILNA